MNRVRIVDLPGLDVGPAVKGKSAYDLLAAGALAQLIRSQAQALRVEPDTPDLIRAFDGCFAASDGRVRAAANEIAAQYGRYLGYLLLTLKRGDAANRTARPDWDERHWVYWATVNAVWLGGGLAAGNLGRQMLPHAQAILAQNGYPQYRLNLSLYPGVLPLLGAARYAPAEASVALLFDFGHSRIKRAYGYYEQGTLTAVRRLPGLDSPCLDFYVAGEEAPPAVLKQQAAAMVELIATAWREAKRITGVELPVMASLACYMHDGHPYPNDAGCYDRLQQLGDNLQAFLARRLSEKLNRPINLCIIHDGTAAAAVYAGAEQTAVLTLGTAMGIGFPPPAAGLRPLATPIKVVA